MVYLTRDYADAINYFVERLEERAAKRKAKKVKIAA